MPGTAVTARKLGTTVGSGDSKQLPAAGGPQVGVSLRRFANLRVRGVPRYQLFKLRRRFDLVFHDHVIKVPSEVGQNAGIPEVPSFGHILQLSRQLARLAWLGDETVANNNQVLSLLSANRTIAGGDRNAARLTPITRDTRIPAKSLVPNAGVNHLSL